MSRLEIAGAICQLSDTELRVFVGWMLGKYSSLDNAAFWYFAVEFFNKRA